jgi:hypothetical protein
LTLREVEHFAPQFEIITRLSTTQNPFSLWNNYLDPQIIEVETVINDSGHGNLPLVRAGG